jgi:hypothetical protein
MGPAFAASLFAYSAQRPDIAHGALVWCVLGLFCIACLVVSRFLPEEPWERGYEAVPMSSNHDVDDDNDDEN